MLGVFIVAALFYIGYRIYLGGLPVRAEIYYGKELVRTVELYKGVEEEITLPGKEGVILKTYSDGSISFEKSDCPDQICVRTGRFVRNHKIFHVFNPENNILFFILCLIIILLVTAIVYIRTQL